MLQDRKAQFTSQPSRHKPKAASALPVQKRHLQVLSIPGSVRQSHTEHSLALGLPLSLLISFGMQACGMDYLVKMPP